MPLCKIITHAICITRRVLLLFTISICKYVTAYIINNNSYNINDNNKNRDDVYHCIIDTMFLFIAYHLLVQNTEAWTFILSLN